MARTRITTRELLDNDVKGVDIDESSLELEQTPFSHPDFTSSNYKDAIVEAKQSENDPYVIGSLTVGDLTINNNSFLVLVSPIIVGDLVIEGEVVIL